MKKVQKKTYMKPQMAKHKAAALVSGSDDGGGSCGCNYYRSSSCPGGTYYH